jgi:hypothetical protein
VPPTGAEQGRRRIAETPCGSGVLSM